MLDRLSDASRTSGDAYRLSPSAPIPEMSGPLLEWLAEVADDPYAFALGAFPWGEPSTALADHVLDPWQIWVLCAIRDRLLTIDEAIQICIETEDELKDR